MSLKIIAISGPLQGKSFQVHEGLQFGRSIGEILLEDPKVSGLHAEVRELKAGELWLFDNKSKNGVRSNGERVERLRLLVDITFDIGSSKFLVQEQEEEIKELAESPAQEEQPPEAIPPKKKSAPQAPSAPKIPDEIPDVELEPVSWNEHAASFLKDHLSLFKDTKSAAIRALIPAVKLSFFRGPQVETSWVLGYGPRDIGSGSVDLPIMDERAPPVCFRILPSESGPIFVTDVPDLVQFNGSSVREQQLSTGDLIRIGEIEIEVELIK